MTASSAEPPDGVTTYVRFDIPAAMSSMSTERQRSSFSAEARYGPTTVGSAPSGVATAAG
jgi:hypothetical protein